MDPCIEQAIREIVRDEMNDHGELTRRNVLAVLGTTGVAGVLGGVGSASASTGASTTTRKDDFAGPDSKKSRLSHNEGRLYHATDTGGRYYDGGSGWNLLPTKSDALFSPDLPPAMRVLLEGSGIVVHSRTEIVGSYDDAGNALQAAHDNLPSGGGRIHLQNGTYGVDYGLHYPAEAVKFTKDNVVLVGESWGAEIRTQDGSTRQGEGANLFRIDGDGCGFVNLAINGNYPNNTPGEEGTVQDGHNIQVRGDGFTFQNIKTYRSTGDGIEIAGGATNTRVSNCLILDNWEHGIGLNSSAETVIEGSVVDTEFHNALIGTFNGTGSVEAVIQGNLLKNASRYALRVQSGNDIAQRIAFKGNLVLDSTDHAIFVQDRGTSTDEPTEVFIENNELIGGSGSAVRINGSKHVELIDNRIQDFDGNAIRVDTPNPVDELVIERNRIVDNNRADTNGRGIWITTNEAAFGHVTIRYNDIYTVDSSYPHFQGINIGRNGSVDISPLIVEGNTVGSWGNDAYRIGHTIDAASRNRPILPLSNPPPSPSLGQEVTADGTNWDPDSDGNAETVRYNGSSWIEVVDYDTTL